MDLGCTLTCRLPHMKFQLADNKLSGEFPMWLLLDAVRCYGDSGCQQVDVDLDGNELWCPLASSLKGECARDVSHVST